MGDSITTNEPERSIRKDTTESGTHVTINAKLSNWIDKIDKDPNAPADLRERCTALQETPPKCISLTLVQKIADYASLRQDKGKTPKTATAYTDDFLQGIKYYFAEGPSPPKRDYENETTVERIRNDAAAREYARMTRNVGSVASKGGNFSFAAEMKVAQTESLAVFNCLLTVFGSGVFAYFATGLAVGDNLVAQILVALLVSCVVAVADIYFLMKKLHKSEVEDDKKRSAAKGPQHSSHIPSQKSKDD